MTAKGNRKDSIKQVRSRKFHLPEDVFIRITRSEYFYGKFGKFPLILLKNCNNVIELLYRATSSVQQPAS